MEPFELALSQVNFEGNDLSLSSSAQPIHSFSNIVSYDSDFKDSSSGSPITAQRVKKSDRSNREGVFDNFLLPETGASNYGYEYVGEHHVQMHLVNGLEAVSVDPEQHRQMYTVPMDRKSQSSEKSTPEKKSDDSGPASFKGFTETVEALALQRSVIGNSSVTPASAEEVARVIALTQMKMKSGETDSDSNSTLSLSISERTNHTDLTDVSSEAPAISAAETAATHKPQTSSSTHISTETFFNLSAEQTTTVHHEDRTQANEAITASGITTSDERQSQDGDAFPIHVNHDAAVAIETETQPQESLQEMNKQGVMEWQHMEISESNELSSNSSSSDLIPIPHEMITKVTEKKGWLSGRSVISPEQSRPAERQVRFNTDSNIICQETTLVKTVSSTADDEDIPAVHSTQKTEKAPNISVSNTDVSETVIENQGESNTGTNGSGGGGGGGGDGKSVEGLYVSTNTAPNDVEKLKGEYDFDTNSYLQTMQMFTSLQRNNGSLSEEGGAARFSPPVKDPGMQPSRGGVRNKGTRYAEKSVKTESQMTVVDQNGNTSSEVNVRNSESNMNDWNGDKNNSYLGLHMPVDTSTPVKGPKMIGASDEAVNMSIDRAVVSSRTVGETIQSSVQTSTVQSSKTTVSKSDSMVVSSSNQSEMRGNGMVDEMDQDITDTKLSARSFQSNVSHNVSHISQSVTEISQTSLVVNIDESSRHRGNGDDTTGDLSLGNNSAAAGEGADLNRSERNEFYSLQEEVQKLRREKAHLEGKVEILEDEAKVAIKERSELQSHLAAVSTQLKSHEKNHKVVVGDKNALSADLETLKQNRQRLELVVMDAQKLIEEKDHDLKTLSEDLKLAHAANEKQQDKMKDFRHEMLAKDETVQALKNKVAELYVEYQNSHQSRILAENEVKSLQSDVTGLQSAKEWYQAQLSQAQETKGKLQQDITQIQRENIASLTLVERLKADNVRSKQALADQQQRALQEKEQLARHLEKIEADMMEREAAFSQIQQERVAMEEAMRQEEEKLRQSEVDSTNLEDLKKLQNELRRKQAQVNVLEHEQTQLVKRLTLAQESLLERDRTIDNLDKKYVDVEVSYKKIQKELELRDEEVLKLKNEKNGLDVELNSIKEEKKSFDFTLHAIKDDMGKVEHSFKQMKLELAGRNDELRDAKNNNENLNHQLAAARARLRVLTQRASPQHQPTEVVELVQRETAEKQHSAARSYDIAPVHKEVKESEGLVVKIVEKQAGSEDSKPEVVILTENASVANQSSEDQVPIAELDNAVIAQLQSQRDALELEINELRAHSKEQEKQLSVQRAALEGDIGKMKEKLAEALTVHQQLKAEKRDVEKVVVEHKERLVEMEVSLRTITEERDSLESKLEEERSRQAHQVASDEVEEKEAMTQLEKENSMLRSKLSETERKLRSDVNKLKAKVLQVTEEYEARLDEERNRQVDYQAALTELNQRLRQAENAKELLAQELQNTQEKFNLSMDEQKEQIQRDQSALHEERQSLEQYRSRTTVELEEVRSSLLLKEETIEILRTKIMEVEVQYREAREQLDESERLRQEEDARRLSLDLEREKGKLAGVLQSHTALKEHTTSLEAALARREASVAGLSTHVQGELQKRDKMIHELKEQIKEHEGNTNKEKLNVKEAKKQLMTEKGQHIKLRRQMETLWVDQDQMKVDLQTRTNDLNMTTLELEKIKHTNMTLKAETERLSIECQTSKRDLEQLKRDLLERERIDPVLREQIQTLEWQLQQKSDELDALKEQLKIVEERQSVEVSSLNKTLQATTSELNSLKLEMQSLRQEKLVLTTKVAQLKSALKASVTHSKKKREQKEAELNKTLPPPFDMAAMERLLQDTAPVDVQSKPLSFLKATLSGLRGEISNLQHQVDEHTNTVQTSSEAWRELELHVKELREVCKTSAAGRAASQVTVTTTEHVTTQVEVHNNDLLDPENARTPIVDL